MDEQQKQQLQTAVRILIEVADQAHVNGPSGRQRDQAVQVLAQHFGLQTEPPANNPPIEMPNDEENTEST